ncbi:S41 family peptidase [Bhargavaea ullalensis]|uniref:Tail specific protease domain-containing protein n=1 Tax=Bhargavaea ullalensis TaxID=1265685 RepID=A0ABV2GEX9_9BACL
MYEKIFKEIVSMMHHDYAGYTDKKGWDNPEFYEKEIQVLENRNELTPLKFVDLVQDYLLDFKDPHLFFNLTEPEQEVDHGFRARRYQDKLFVTSLSGETRLTPGDAILSLDHIPVQELAETHRRELMENKAEREDWRQVIPKYLTAQIEEMSGNTRTLDLRKYRKSEYVPQHTVQQVDDHTLLMTLTDFFDPTPINGLLETYQEELENSRNLIIDVRRNLGGSTLSYKQLEKYLFPEGSNQVDFSFYHMKVNCTERNADLIIKSIEDELDHVDDESYRNALMEWKEQTWEKHRGKGFVSFEEDSSDSDYMVTGQPFPENIIVLIDNYCGSAGDIFAYLCKQSPKVTMIGRPTMGVNDYSNLSEMVWDHQFKLMYATSRLTQLDSREQNAEQGIRPDVYIPWTPEHIHQDQDMEKALAMLVTDAL